MNNKLVFFEELVNSKHYKTQAVSEFYFEQKCSHLEKVDDDDLRKIKLLWIYNNCLYKHQKECFDAFKKGENVILSNYFNTGRSTIAIICALKKIFEECRTVLYLAKNEYDKELHIKHIKHILNNLNYEWIIDVEYFPKEKINFADFFPLLLILDVKELTYKILPNHKEFKAFWNSLGLVVLENLDTYSGNLASNLYYIIKRLNKVIEINQGNPQYFITTKPIQNLENYVSKIIGSGKNTVISGDYKEMNSYGLIQWVPAIANVNVSIYEGKDHMCLERSDYYEEVIRISLEALAKGKNILIYHSGIPISSKEIEKYNERLASEVREKGIGKWFISDDLEEVSVRIFENGLKFENIDVIIVVGLEGPFSSVLLDLRHIGNDNTEKFFVMPKFPQYQFFITHPYDFTKLESISDSLRIEEAKALFNMNEKEEEITKKNYLIMAAEKLLSLSEINQEIKEELIKEDLLDKELNLTDKGKKLVEECKKLEGEDLNISKIGNYFKIYDEANSLLMCCDPIEAINYFYPYAIVKIINNRYQVENVDIDKKEIRVKKAENFWVSYPVYSINIKEEKINKNIRYENSLEIYIGEAFIKLNLEKIKVSIFLKVSDLKTYDFKGFNIEDKVNFIKLGPFESDSLAHTIGHLLYTAICTRFMIKEKERPKFFIKDKVIYLYSSFYFGKEFFELLCDPTVIKDLLERSYSIIADCPCSSGCFGCLEIFECSNEIKCQNLSKLDAIRYLGGILKKEEEADKLVSWRNEGLNSDTDTEKLDSIKIQSLNILKKKAMMEIKNPYMQRFFTPHDKEEYGDYAGICDPKKGQVMVVEKKTEEDTLEIISHEYAHNWQFEGNLNPIFTYFNVEDIDDPKNIIFAGDIFREGQAVFATIKVLDYFGIDRKSISLKGYNINQYKYGANLVLYLENIYGYKKLLDILKTANISSNISSEENISINDIIKKWYIDSKVAAGIQADINKIIQDGGLKCLKCLGKDPNDLNRCSYHLEVTSKMIKKKEIIADLIRDQEIAEIIWTILKEAIAEVGGCRGDKCEEGCNLPCINCNRAALETLEEVCVLFKSISYAKKIREKIAEMIKNKK